VFLLLSFSRRLNAFANQGLKGMRAESLMLFADAAITRDEANLSTIDRRDAIGAASPDNPPA
jgi:hypothetical protein